MANVYLQDSTLTAIGDAIRTKAGNTNKLLPSEMPDAIANLPSGGGADELEVIKSLDQHVVVSANGADALKNEHNQAYGYVSAPTASIIPLAAMGLQGYENFMKNCIYLQWQGDYYTSNTSTMKYSNVRCFVIPAFGSYQNRYVYGFMTYAKQQMTSGGSVSGYDPSLALEGVGTNRPSFVLDTTDGTLYSFTHSIGSGGSLVNPKIGGAYTKGQVAKMAIYYKKKL